MRVYDEISKLKCRNVSLFAAYLEYSQNYASTERHL